MKKSILTIMAMGILLLYGGITVIAAPKTMPDGTIFDAEYYAQSNPDVVAVFGTDESLLYQHYVQYGKKEGRVPVNYEKNIGDTNYTVTVEPGDENYLRLGFLAGGYDYELGGRFDPANGFVRKDWSNNTNYQKWRTELEQIILAANGEQVEGKCEYSVCPRTEQEELDIISIIDNLNVDLEKEGIAKYICLLNNPADGYMHSGFYAMTVVYDINDVERVKENISAHLELKGYY